MKGPNLVGQKFNRLTVIKYSHKGKSGESLWILKCDCGNNKNVIASTKSLRSEHTRSCGCLQKELSGAAGKKACTTHGFPYGTKDQRRFYHIWDSMKQRCFNAKNISYPNYGGRGITVCNTWLKFENFRDDMWESYLKHVEEFGSKNTSIDRVDNDGNYELSNCKWSTLEEQMNGTRLSSIMEDKKSWIAARRFATFLNYTIMHRKTSQYSNLLGASLDFVRKHIESQFEPWMTWNNYGKGKDRWNIDHIKSLRLFDFTKENAWLEAFHYTNLRPILDEDNVKKH